MAKYSYEFKKKVVDAYLNGDGGYSYLSSAYGPNTKDIRTWVNNYRYEELKSEIERYIKYYNEQRIKEKLGWMSPVQYRFSLLAA